MKRAVEFRIPIVPDARFYANVRLAALSLQALGEPYASARIVVSTGGDAPAATIEAATPWASRFPIEWYVVPAAVWAKGGHEAGAALDRFPPLSQATVTVHCDADVCLVARIDELLERLDTDHPRVAGVMAHQSPFARDPAANDAAWRAILDRCGLADAALEHSYALADPSVCGRCPAYFNAGFIALNERAGALLQPLLPQCIAAARAFLKPPLDPAYAVQVGFSVALLKSGIEPEILGLEYNCPNTDDVFARRPDLAHCLKVVHYQRRDEFDRHTFLSTDAACSTFLGTAFRGDMNRIFQEHVRRVWPRSPA